MPKSVSIAALPAAPDFADLDRITGYDASTNAPAGYTPAVLAAKLQTLITLTDTTGGAAISNAHLTRMALAEEFTFNASPVPTRDAASDLITSAAVTWADGSGGTFTGTVNASFGAYSSIAITHALSGKTATETITRDALGRATSTIAVTP